jgi:hypothetical protein
VARSRDEVEVAVVAHFAESERATVLAALDRYGTERHESERERVQLAIVELSGGDQDRLLELVRDAKIDYRDILARQELGPLPPQQGQQLQDQARAVLKAWGRKS